MQTETGNVLAAGEHIPEGLGLVEEVVPPPMESGAPIKNPKNLGESLLNQIDPHQEILTFDQRRKVLSIREPEDVRRILLNDLGSAMTPNLESAEQIFSALAKLKIDCSRLWLI